MLHLSKCDALTDDSSADSKNLNYKPYTSLIPDTDALGKRYPITFENPKIMDGCICYDVNSGMTDTGMTYTIRGA